MTWLVYFIFWHIASVAQTRLDSILSYARFIMQCWLLNTRSRPSVKGLFQAKTQPKLLVWQDIKTLFLLRRLQLHNIKNKHTISSSTCLTPRTWNSEKEMWIRRWSGNSAKRIIHTLNTRAYLRLTVVFKHVHPLRSLGKLPSTLTQCL